MHRNPFYTYLLNLAVADFLFLCLHTTATLLNVIEIFLPINIPRYGILGTVATFSYLVDMNMISAISTERCLSVLCPIWYHCHRPRRTSAVICALLWALSMFLSILISVVCKNSNILDHICDEVELTITVWLVLLFVVLLVSSLALLGRMLCGSQKKSLTRLYVTILLTVLVFFFCGLPFGFSLCLYWLMKINYHVFICLDLIPIVLSCVNSSANPIIYFFVGSFRLGLQGQNLKIVLERALQDTPGKDESGGSLSQGTLEMSGSRVEQG
ncbi:mas-related G-protein coupled receptor member X3-like [Callospermophilus lateralis]|uniref:mas-related G-protein coupled receptor member X3-like n=1 Tax=Callospermophilus lateralis TaxID=76772 RepID=UPI0040539B3F